MSSVSTVTTHSKQDFEFHLHLTMGEAAVLRALFVYGHKSILEEALKKGGAINENVTDPERILAALSDKIRGPLWSEFERCMRMRHIFHHPQLYDITKKDLK